MDDQIHIFPLRDRLPESQDRWGAGSFTDECRLYRDGPFRSPGNFRLGFRARAVEEDDPVAFATAHDIEAVVGFFASEDEVF